MRASWVIDSFKALFVLFFVDCVVLGFVGANSPDDISPIGLSWLTLGQLGTVWYFFHFIFFLPLLSIFETPKPLPASISEPVLGGGSAGAAATSKAMEKA